MPETFHTSSPFSFLPMAPVGALAPLASTVRVGQVDPVFFQGPAFTTPRWLRPTTRHTGFFPRVFAPRATDVFSVLRDPAARLSRAPLESLGLPRFTFSPQRTSSAGATFPFRRPLGSLSAKLFASGTGVAHSVSQASRRIAAPFHPTTLATQPSESATTDPRTTPAPAQISLPDQNTTGTSAQAQHHSSPDLVEYGFAPATLEVIASAAPANQEGISKISKTGSSEIRPDFGPVGLDTENPAVDFGTGDFVSGAPLFSEKLLATLNADDTAGPALWPDVDSVGFDATTTAPLSFTTIGQTVFADRELPAGFTRGIPTHVDVSYLPDLSAINPQGFSDRPAPVTIMGPGGPRVTMIPSATTSTVRVVAGLQASRAGHPSPLTFVDLRAAYPALDIRSAQSWDAPTSLHRVNPVSGTSTDSDGPPGGDAQDNPNPQ